MKVKNWLNLCAKITALTVIVVVCETRKTRCNFDLEKSVFNLTYTIFSKNKNEKSPQIEALKVTNEMNSSYLSHLVVSKETETECGTKTREVR